MKNLLAHGAEVDGASVVSAAHDGHAEMVTLLLEHNPNIETSYLSEALELASSSGSTDIVKNLLAHGADVDGESVVSAADGGHVEVLNLLLKHNPNMETKYLSEAL